MQIGKYLLGKKLGQGGFGVVFRAHDGSLDREVALKFLNAEASSTPQILQRFLQEARSAAKVAHPGIVTVYECGQLAEANNAAYIAMELLDGESLTDRLARSGRLAPGEAMEIARQVASALEAAHRAGIVHRDLKPDNIFLVKDPAVVNGERIKVLDFGIAKLGRNAASSMQTQAAGSGVNTLSMMVFGTPRYMSPEQCKSAAHVDHRSDIYTLGCILFELVTGKPPFGGSAGELIACHVLVEPPSVLSLVPDAPPELAMLIAAMLAKEPDARPQTMAAVQRQLESGGALSPGVAPTLLPNAMPPLAPRASGSFGIPPQPQPTPQAVFTPAQPISGRISAPVAVASPTTLGGAASSSVSKKTGAPQSKKRLAIYVAGAGLAAAIGLTVGLAMRGGNDSDTQAPPQVAEPTIRAATVKPEPKAEPKLESKAEPKVESKAEPKTEPKIEPKVEVKTDAKKPAVTKKPAATVKAKAETSKPEPVATIGSVTVTTTPSCEVRIDGAASGLHTPIRAYKLPSGAHRITLINPELGVNETISVDIKDGVTETVSRDYSKKQSKDKTINPFAKSSAP
ncbi:MAG TPA: protein kinase [Kofleriaceae bacterium]|nr:protein kinase [Kofleriaceae bacterium]